MHCPQCGQPFTGEVSFCKGCGFSLEGTKELFAPADKQRTAFKDWIKKRRRSRGRRGVYRGTIVIAIGIALLAFMGTRDGVYPLVILIAGLLRILFAMAFQEVISTKAEYSGRVDDDLRITPAPSVAAGILGGDASVNERASLYDNIGTLPDGRVSARYGTGEVAERPSVTEHTTNLLNLAEDDRDEKS
jgi:hypothetical protein